MVIGALGDIPFEVSEETVRTISSLVWSGSARYATHQRHGTDALTEFVGRDPDGITFSLHLSAYLGVNPMEEIAKLWDYQRTGEALVFVLGNKVYGKYRWNLVRHEIKAETYDNEGDVTSATVSITLQEYLRA